VRCSDRFVEMQAVSLHFPLTSQSTALVYPAASISNVGSRCSSSTIALAPSQCLNGCTRGAVWSRNSDAELCSSSGYSRTSPLTLRRLRPGQVVCMAKERRVKMVSQQIKREISEMLLYDKVVQAAVLPETALGADMYLTAVATISEVEMSKDLSVSSLGPSLVTNGIPGATFWFAIASRKVKEKMVCNVKLFVGTYVVSNRHSLPQLAD
jgi:hypothetical protein